MGEGLKDHTFYDGYWFTPFQTSIRLSSALEPNLPTRSLSHAGVPFLPPVVHIVIPPSSGKPLLNLVRTGLLPKGAMMQLFKPMDVNPKFQEVFYRFNFSIYKLVGGSAKQATPPTGASKHPPSRVETKNHLGLNQWFISISFFLWDFFPFFFCVLGQFDWTRFYKISQIKNFQNRMFYQNKQFGVWLKSKKRWFFSSETPKNS